MIHIISRTKKNFIYLLERQGGGWKNVGRNIKQQRGLLKLQEILEAGIARQFVK